MALPVRSGSAELRRPFSGRRAPSTYQDLMSAILPKEACAELSHLTVRAPKMFGEQCRTHVAPRRSSSPVRRSKGNKSPLPGVYLNPRTHEFVNGARAEPRIPEVPVHAGADVPGRGVSGTDRGPSTSPAARAVPGLPAMAPRTKRPSPAEWPWRQPGSSGARRSRSPGIRPCRSQVSRGAPAGHGAGTHRRASGRPGSRSSRRTQPGTPDDLRHRHADRQTTVRTRYRRETLDSERRSVLSART